MVKQRKAEFEEREKLLAINISTSRRCEHVNECVAHLEGMCGAESLSKDRNRKRKRHDGSG